MNRLWVRLVLAFALVVLVAVGAVALLAGLTAGQEFNRYLTYGDAWPTQEMVDQLADFYRTHNGWQGVEAVLHRDPPPSEPWIGTRHDEGPGRFEMVLADAMGVVVYDRPGGQAGRQLTSDEQAAARAIEVNGQTVGQLVIVVPPRPDFLSPLEQWFVARLQWWLIIGALLAGGLGLLLGVILSRSLTAPLRRLADAARAVAGRDFTRRVQEEGSTEIAELAQAFNQMTTALEESERLRKNMVADVAHELRTPLSVLQGNLQAILDDVYAMDKAEIARLFDETRLLSRLVDDLRELALADAGQLRLNLRPFELAPVLRSTMDSLAVAAEAHGVTLSAQVPADLPTVQGDPDRLSQVLRNLLVNALQHTPAGGAVTVTVAATPEGIEVAVTDTGEGIAAVDLPYIFDRFWRAEHSRTRDKRWPGGTGLGLSVAQSLVQAQGGRIWAESVAGQGSTFRFALPRA
jgi:two-component system OmpR family sensor kinase/two-component system sensor histidine kinase BaeS